MDKVFKALADPTRRGILKLLRERELSAGEIAASFSLSKPTLSGHFAVLRAADLVSTERQGTSQIYRLNCSVLEEALMGFADIFSLGTPARTHTHTHTHTRKQASKQGLKTP